MSARLLNDLPIRTPAQLGQVLRAQRKAQGFTLKQCSGLSGLGTRFLSELERGKATAELGKTLQVANLLGLDCFMIPRSHTIAADDGSADDDAG